MTRIALLLDATHVRVLPEPAGRAMLDVPWTPSEPAAAVRRLQEALGSAHSLVLVVGLGWLEIARPELPPLDASLRQQLLVRDADRYFPLPAAAAASWSDGLAFAMSAATLAEWVRAFSALGTVDAVVTLPWACARSGIRGLVQVGGGPGEIGLITVREGAVEEARRVPAMEPAAMQANAPDASKAQLLDVAAVLRAATDAVEVSLDAQLLDADTRRQIERRRASRVLRSVVLFAAALVALSWSADRWRARTYESLRSESTRLASAAEPARLALLRVQRAELEVTLLDSAARVAASGKTPSVVLARLGSVLPRDAFVQRLDWDGTLWRLDGSALDAPRIVPLLDADPVFTDVRILAASTRFPDGGRQRESFSIAFSTQGNASLSAGPARGGARAVR